MGWGSLKIESYAFNNNAFFVQNISDRMQEASKAITNVALSALNNRPSISFFNPIQSITAYLSRFQLFQEGFKVITDFALSVFNSFQMLSIYLLRMQFDVAVVRAYAST